MDLLTVYKTYAAKMQEIGGDTLPGSIEISGGTIDLAFSNSETEPAPMDMTPDPNGPYSGTIEIAPAARWIGAIAASGTPVLRSFRVIAP